MNNKNKNLVTRSYTMPKWLFVMLRSSAQMNDRSESAEMRVRLANSFGMNPDGTRMPLPYTGKEGGEK